MGGIRGIVGKAGVRGGQSIVVNEAEHAGTRLVAKGSRQNLAPPGGTPDDLIDCRVSPPRHSPSKDCTRTTR